MGAIQLDEGRRRPFVVAVKTDYPHYAGKEDRIIQLAAATAEARLPRLVDGIRIKRSHLNATILQLESEWLRLQSS